MDAFATACNSVIGLEGGYSNNAADPGGETMWGITLRTARAYGYTGDMRALPRDVATAIYRKLFWDPLRLDELGAISQIVATELFDTNVNFYAGAAPRFLQRTLRAMGDASVSVDGVVGDGTLLALKRYLAARGRDGEIVLMRCLNGLQAADYIRQVEAAPAKSGFLFGWVRARVVI